MQSAYVSRGDDYQTDEREQYKPLLFTNILTQTNYAFKLAKIYDCMCYYCASGIAENSNLKHAWDAHVDEIFVKLQEVDRGMVSDIDVSFIHQCIDAIKPWMKNIDTNDTMRHLMQYIISTISKIDAEID